MKPLTLILLLSLAANAALLGAGWKTLSERPKNATLTERVASNPRISGPQASSSAANPQPSASAVWPDHFTTDGPNLGALIHRLRAAGLAEVDIMHIVRAALQQVPSPARIEAYRASSRYWTGYSASRPSSPELLGETLASHRLWREYFVNSGLWQRDPETVSLMRDRYGDLPMEKLHAIMVAESDLKAAKLQREIDTPAENIPGQPRSTQLSAIYTAVDDEERVKAIQGILTADEFAEYQMRYSPLASKVRTALVPFQASEEEYAAIYAIEKTLSDDPAFKKLSRREQQQKKNEAVAAALPAERAADYAYLGAPNDQAKLMARLGLPLSTIGTLNDQHTRVSDAITAVRQDASLSAQEKLTRYRAMLADTKVQLTTTLGAEGAEAYTKSNRDSPVFSLEALIADSAKKSGP